MNYFKKADELETWAHFERNVFPMLNVRAGTQGLHAYLYDHHRNDQARKNSGVFFITSPDEHFQTILLNDPELFDKLMEERSRHSDTFFDANYWITDVTDYASDHEEAALLLDLMRNIDIQAFAVHTFRMEGYKEYPSLMSEHVVREMIRMHDRLENGVFMPEVWSRYNNAYKNFVKYVYDSSMEFSRDVQRPVKGAIKQRIFDPLFFVKNKVPTDTIQISDDFKPYFEKAIKDYPFFYYYRTFRPTLKIKDISHLDDSLKNEKGKTEWQITFPARYSGVYYTILNRFFNENEPGQVQNLSDLGEPRHLRKFALTVTDVHKFAVLAQQNGLKFYINKGDLADITKENCFDRNYIAVNEDDWELTDEIVQKIYYDLKPTRSVRFKEGDRGYHGFDPHIAR